jgi:hypothetical protein
MQMLYVYIAKTEKIEAMEIIPLADSFMALTNEEFRQAYEIL